MPLIEVKSTDYKVIITIDKKFVDVNFLTNLFHKFRVEQLITKANFDEETLKLSKGSNKIDRIRTRGLS